MTRLNLCFSLVWACSLLAACGAPVPDGAQPPGEPELERATVIDVTSVTNVWSPAEGLSLLWIRPVGDVNDDGIGDAGVATFNNKTQENVYYVVYGPLRGKKTIPGDEDLTLLDFLLAGDVTGNGITDFVLRSEVDDSQHMLASPLAADVDLVDDRIALPDYASDDSAVRVGFSDVDGDGILDKIESEERVYSITLGPNTRWTGSVDLTLDAEDCSASGEGAFSNYLAVSLPDITGDDVPELHVDATAQCGGHQVVDWPGEDDSNTITLEARPVGTPLNRNFTITPDQTGDGMHDVLRSDGAGGYELLVSPVTIGEQSLVAARTIAVAETDSALRLLGADSNGDGISDFATMTRDFDNVGDIVAGWSMRVLEGGETSLTTTIRSTIWEMGPEFGLLPGGPIEEDGFVSIPIRLDGSIYLVDVN